MSIFSDPFYDIAKGEAFEKSQCIRHERNAIEAISNMLSSIGYESKDKNNHIWRLKEKTVVVCLVDDFSIFKTRNEDLPGCFDSNTVVITDNRVTVPTNYKVFTLPDSFIGTFYYVPGKNQFQPTKRFSFSVNRLDYQRELILLDLIAQSGGVDQWMQLDYANFNCFNPNRSNDNVVDSIKNFLAVWDTLAVDFPEYSVLVQQIQKHLPIRNHLLSVEQAHVSAYLTVVCETYAGDNNIVFSEKIFRALVTPAPWTMYGGHGSVKWLADLGFDVLDDIVDHSYNQINQAGSLRGIRKIQNFNASNIKNYEELKKISITKLKNRCIKAALYNQKKLLALSQQWTQDFADWLPGVASEIAGK